MIKLKKIAIIGAGEFQLPLIKKAKLLGFETHVFSWEQGAAGKGSADYFYPVSITEKEKILNQCKKIKPEGIVTIASDLANITVQYVAEKLNLVTNSKQCIRVTTDKYLMRVALSRKGIPTPKFAKFNTIPNNEELKDFSLPIIVKPTDRSGSRGITKLDSFSEKKLTKAFSVAQKDSFDNSVIIEEFVDGIEYSCESVSYDGKHHILGITRKFTTGSPNFIEKGHIAQANLPEKIVKEIHAAIPTALDCLGVEYGPSHSEFKITNSEEIRIIEVGSRMGGDYIGSDLVPLSTGYDFLRMTIDIATGKKLEIENTIEQYPYCAIRFSVSDQDSSLLRQLELKHSEKMKSELVLSKSDHVIDSSSRKGSLIAVFDKYDEALKMLELSD
ncbi:ATP-grasp domain-containing protein [Enterococcus sp. AZ072]|uniref:ATP-grasp domain-containing protein n=1 Tax=unclassified Enterococcus TaxID=2608891 RepID=UPI003D2A8F21